MRVPLRGMNYQEYNAKSSESLKLLRNTLIVLVSSMLAITPWTSIDAFTPAKFAVTTIGCFYLLIFHFLSLKKVIMENPIVSRILIIYLVLLCFILYSRSYSISERVYGISGRAFGFLSYINLVLLFIIGFTIQRNLSRKIIQDYLTKFLCVSNLIIVLVSFFQDAGLMLNNFQNYYGSWPATLGNPNYFSAVVAITSFSWIQLFLKQAKFGLFKVLSVVGILSSYYAIIQSHSFQGIVIVVAGFAFLFLVFLKGRLKSPMLYQVMIMISTILGLISALGLFGYGPLSSTFSQDTAKFRLYYAKVGFRMFLDSPIFGQGFDTYYDNFRRFRSLSEFQQFGEGVVSDSAHNYWIELAASGGVVILVAPLTLIIMSLYRSFEICLRKSKNLSDDSSFIAVFFVGWFLQSLINPFNVFLAAFGFFLIGILVAPVYYDAKKYQKHKKTVVKNRTRAMTNPILFFAIRQFIFICISAISLVPLVTDSQFRTAVVSSKADKLVNVALQWPVSPSRAVAIASGLVESQLNTQTIDSETLLLLENQKLMGINIVKRLTSINSNSFEAWRFVHRYGREEKDKVTALVNLQRLDPQNSEWKK